MKILKSYELIVEARKIYLKIKEESLDYLAYLTDVGYTVACRDDLRWIIVYISKDREKSAFYDGIKFSDINDDIISYIEYMSDKYYIEFVDSSVVKIQILILKIWEEVEYTKLKI